MTAYVPMKPRQGYDVSDHMTTHVPPSNQVADSANDNMPGNVSGLSFKGGKGVGVWGSEGVYDSRGLSPASLPTPSNDNKRLRLVK